MAMRETFRSLRAYFILSGAVGTAWTISSLVNEPKPPVLKACEGVNLAFSAAFLASGVALQSLLRHPPRLLRGLLYATMVWSVSCAVVVLAVSGDTAVLVPPAIGLLVAWYLLVNVNRLSTAEKPLEPKE